MVTKSCTKILNFRAKILPSKISERSLWGKNIFDGEMFCLGMGSTNLYFYALLCGGDTKSKLPAKILPSKISERSSWGKNIFDGEMFCLAMVSTNLYFYALLCGGDTKSKLPN